MCIERSEVQVALGKRAVGCLYVIRLKDRQSPNADVLGFNKEKASIVSRLTEQKRQATYQNWLADLKSRSKIDVNEELITAGSTPH